MFMIKAQVAFLLWTLFFGFINVLTTFDVIYPCPFNDLFSGSDLLQLQNAHEQKLALLTTVQQQQVNFNCTAYIGFHELGNRTFSRL